MILARDHQDTPKRNWRTPIAISLAVALGAPIGFFLNACAVAFGPVLLGWLVALVGAVAITAGLSVLAMDRYVSVGVGYAAGVAVTAVVASVSTVGIGESWLGPLASFGVVFFIVAAASLFGSIPCALVKWEDKKVREHAQRPMPRH